MESDTIIGVEHEAHAPLRSMLQGDYGIEPTCGDEVSRLFKIRSADSLGQRSSASVLINRMYSARGYRTTPLASSQQPTRITFTATEHKETIGTITVGFDSAIGLHVDELFEVETEDLRAQGRRICEFTKLAMDSVVKSKRVLASLFHVAYIFRKYVLDKPSEIADHCFNPGAKTWPNQSSTSRTFKTPTQRATTLNPSVGLTA